MKFLKAAAAALPLLLLLSSCSNSHKAAKDIAVRAVMDVQSYENGSIVEIPRLYYNSESRFLSEQGGEIPDIKLINSSIEKSFKANYEQFRKEKRKGCIDIRTYPFDSERYVQLVITYNEYPTYGTDGFLQSFCFDKLKNELITAEERLRHDSITLPELKEKAKELYTSEYEGDFLSDASLSGFVILEDRTLYLMTLTVRNENSPTRILFYSLSLSENSLKRLDKDMLFDKGLLSRLDPPLYYDREEGANKRSFPLKLILKAENLNESGENKYSLEGKTEITIKSSEPVPVFASHISELVKNAEGGKALDITCEYDLGLTEKIEYPAFVLEYKKPLYGRELRCLDMVLVTESAAFRVHTETDEKDYYRIKDKIIEAFGSADFVY